ncbi:hypothetical protein Tco_1217092 [Tanacetum coccineum]
MEIYGKTCCHGYGVTGLWLRRNTFEAYKLKMFMHNSVSNFPQPILGFGNKNRDSSLRSGCENAKEELPLYWIFLISIHSDGNLRELSGKKAWEAIENFAQGQKEWDNPPNIISEQEVANLKAQAKRFFGNDHVWVEMHREEVEETIGIPMEVEPFDQKKLEDLAHFAPMQPTQVNKITTSCEICIGPHDTQYCMENPEQPFIEYASSRTNEAGEFVCTKGDDGDVMFIEIVKKNDNSRKEELEAGGLEERGGQKRGVEYIMSKILGFYKECLELGPEYVTRMDDEGEVM